ncbi:type VI secretion system-associated protein TagF [Pseudooceanicola sp. 502str34]
MTGVFGKLPVAGDFVARGLAPGQRARVDAWLTRHLAEAARWPERWPAEGLYALIEGEAPLLLLVVPSCDAAGRAFPLAAVVPGDGITQAGAERWGAAVLPHLDRATEGLCDAGELAGALTVALEDEPGEGGPPLVPPLVWARGRAPVGPETLAALMPSG